jgi:hypothetical protein
VKFYAARVPRYDTGGDEAVAVIRQRDRSDHDYPDIGHFPDLGQELTWQLSWQHTTMLIDDRRGNCVWDITQISRDQAGQTAAELAARWWPPDAAPPAALGRLGIPIADAFRGAAVCVLAG